MKQSTINKLQMLERGDLPSNKNAGFLGASIDEEDAQLVLLHVPWDATASYGKGTRYGPQLIIKASHQIDLYDVDFGLPFWAGFCDKKIKFNSKIINKLKKSKHSLKNINEASEHINEVVYEQSKKILSLNKFVGVIGGEHSVPYGLIKALGEKYSEFGILHIDAHHDLRKAFEGYEYSHASIIYNILEKIPQVSKVISIGIRDFCKEEFIYASANPKIYTVYDNELFKARINNSKAFLDIIHQAIDRLPSLVYISFDIDGLCPQYCPGTGTPVPGGLDFNEAMFIIKLLAEHNKIVIGFDLCEVAPSKVNPLWDGNVGARVLYKLCGVLAYTNKLYDLTTKRVCL